MNRYLAEKVHICMLSRNDIYEKKSRFISTQHVKRKLSFFINQKKSYKLGGPVTEAKYTTKESYYKNVWSLLLVQLLFSSFTPLLTFIRRLIGWGSRTCLLSRRTSHVSKGEGEDEPLWVP